MRTPKFWYARVVEDPGCSAEDLFSYGEILKINSRYPEAIKVFKSYQAKTGDKKRVAISIAAVILQMFG